MNASIAELIEAARNASATLGHAYHTVLTGELAENAHTDYQRLDAALANIHGDSEQGRSRNEANGAVWFFAIVGVTLLAAYALDWLVFFVKFFMGVK